MIRISKIVNGEGLVADLMYRNAGRPSNTFRIYAKLKDVTCNDMTAEDDGRYWCAHVAPWIYLDGMIQYMYKQSLLPESTPILFKSLKKLQFMPCNKYVHSTLNFNSTSADR